jgi:hypothetical protein
MKVVKLYVVLAAGDGQYHPLPVDLDANPTLAKFLEFETFQPLTLSRKDSDAPAEVGDVKVVLGQARPSQSCKLCFTCSTHTSSLAVL